MTDEIITRVLIDGWLDFFRSNPSLAIVGSALQRQIEMVLESSNADAKTSLETYSAILDHVSSIYDDATGEVNSENLNKVMDSISKLGPDFDLKGYAHKGVFLQDFPSYIMIRFAVELFNKQPKLIALSDGSDLSFWAKVSIQGFLQRLYNNCLDNAEWGKFFELLKIIARECPKYKLISHVEPLIKNFAYKKFFMQIVYYAWENIVSRSQRKETEDKFNDYNWLYFKFSLVKKNVEKSLRRSLRLEDCLVADFSDENVAKWSYLDFGGVLVFDYRIVAGALGKLDQSKRRFCVQRMHEVYLSKDYVGPIVLGQLVHLYATLRRMKVNTTFVGQGVWLKMQAELCDRIYNAKYDMRMVDMQVLMLNEGIDEWLAEHDAILFNKVMVQFPAIAQEILSKRIGVSRYLAFPQKKRTEIAVQMAKLCLPHCDSDLCVNETTQLRMFSSFLWLLPTFESFVHSVTDDDKTYQNGLKLWNEYYSVLKLMDSSDYEGCIKQIGVFRNYCLTLLSCKPYRFFRGRANSSSACNLKDKDAQQLRDLVCKCKLVADTLRVDLVECVDKERFLSTWPGMVQKVGVIDQKFNRNAGTKIVRSAPASFVF